jgi:hypothetical protein
LLHEVDRFDLTGLREGPLTKPRCS